MVQLTIDTKHDDIHELEHALELIQKALAARTTTVAEQVQQVETPVQTAQELIEETALDTPFFKVTVANEEKVPVSNDTGESITEDELTGMFAEQGIQVEKKEFPEETGDGSFIEIVDLDSDN